MGQYFSATCETKVRLDGKTTVITGSNSGIGKPTAKDFYERGARVILACRNVDKAKEVINDIKKLCEGGKNLGELIAIKLDLLSLQSVRECATELLKTEERINILVKNACVIGVPYTKTEDGFELTFQTNYLSHFLFTLLLLPLLIKSTPTRIVNITSNSHKMMCSTFDLDDLNFEKRKYSFIKANAESKLCNILFTKEMVRKLEENNVLGITVYAVHPGRVKREAKNTVISGGYNLWLAGARIFFKTPEQGAQTIIYCSVDKKCSEETGLYYAECKPCEPSRNANDVKLARDLWDLSMKYVGFKEEFNHFIDKNA